MTSIHPSDDGRRLVGQGGGIHSEESVRHAEEACRSRQSRERGATCTGARELTDPLQVRWVAAHCGEQGGQRSWPAVGRTRLQKRAGVGNEGSAPGSEGGTVHPPARRKRVRWGRRQGEPHERHAEQQGRGVCPAGNPRKPGTESSGVWECAHADESEPTGATVECRSGTIVRRGVAPPRGSGLSLERSRLRKCDERR